MTNKKIRHEKDNIASDWERLQAHAMVPRYRRYIENAHSDASNKMNTYSYDVSDLPIMCFYALCEGLLDAEDDEAHNYFCSVSSRYKDVAYGFGS